MSTTYGTARRAPAGNGRVQASGRGNESGYYSTSSRGRDSGSRGASSGRGSSSRSSSGRGTTSGRGSSSRSGSGRGTTSGRGSSSRSGSGRGTASGRNTSSRSRSGYGSSQTTYRSYRSTRRKPSPDYRIIAIIGVILILVIAAVAFAMTQHPGKSPVKETSSQSETTSVPETELQKEVTVDGITITGMSRDEAKEAILKNYPWKMTAAYGSDVYELANLMSGKVDALLEEIFTGAPKEKYTLDTSGLDDAVAGQVAAMKERWNKSPRSGGISGYDSANDSFTFADGESGVAIDEEKLARDIRNAIQSKDFDAQLQVTASAVEPEMTREMAQNLYKTISTYTTKTTANSRRNTNVRLAAEQLNGTIVQPGEEMSFNDTVGERTEAKGYQSAAAYNNGEVVQEIGGGVCQVSTTLYNAVVRAGLKISRRQSHTFEPSYVTPGMDATVSWGGPDFRFINNSSSPVGIKARYHDQTMTVSVYGIPILEEGVTYDLESKKIEDLDPPPPTYEEDQTVPLDEEVVVSDGSSGSRWETRLVIKKNGELVSNDVDHNTSYKGHAPVIKRNTSGVWIPPEDETGESESESGSENGESVPVAPDGPGNPQPTPESTGEAPSIGPGSTGPTDGPISGSPESISPAEWVVPSPGPGGGNVPEPISPLSP